MEKIILDTNLLMAIKELKVDIFAEIFKVCDFPYELCVLDRTIEELENLIKTSLLSKRQASQLALKLVEAKKVKILRTHDSRHVDDILVDLGKNGAIIGTADRELKLRLHANKSKILTLRQKKYIILE
ncbi:hypothetical protein HZA98_04630 [Candidatus Woesearchaeota archaeon]|nr:hypothetical protein [Candidatus Woesearchaeota archaeon]